MSNTTNTRGFDTSDAIDVCREWVEQCNQVGYESDQAGGWVDVFVDEFKRGIDTDDDQSHEWSDHDVLIYWHTLIGEALKHINAPKQIEVGNNNG